MTPGPKYSFSIELLRLTDSLWNASRVFLSRWDLSPSQFNILNLLDGRPEGCAQVELSRELIVHRSNITGLVDRLVARGLVERHEHPSDRRAFCVVLAPEGKKLMRKIQPFYYAAAEELWGELPLTSAQELITRLTSINAAALEVAAANVVHQSTKKNQGGRVHVINKSAEIPERGTPIGGTTPPH
jgi:DNA-binding MarR family transcriptional regulator